MLTLYIIVKNSSTEFHEGLAPDILSRTEKWTLSPHKEFVCFFIRNKQTTQPHRDNTNTYLLLISNIRRVLNVVFFLLGASPQKKEYNILTYLLTSSMEQSPS
jgi:hypothetical protein